MSRLANELRQFLALIVFGNIENLILASQGVAAGVNPIVLACLSVIPFPFAFKVNKLS